MAYLRGKTTFQIILNQKDLETLLARVGDACDEEGSKLLERLGDVAVEFLRRFELGVGRKWVASNWARTRAYKDGQTGYRLEVYNRIEDRTIRNTNAWGVRTNRYTIKGENLLRILEYGAGPHPIEPRRKPKPYRRSRGGKLIQPHPFLAFLSPQGAHKSIFHGTLYKAPKNPTDAHAGFGAFLHRSSEPDDTIFTSYVNHPGVTGDEFLRHTQDQITRRLADEATAALRGIQARLK